jgi:Ca-activated chloride channel homolog
MPSGYDFYTLLGLAPQATAEEIKSAYRQMARRFHPDTNKNNPGAAWQFQLVNEAYQTLGDPIYRQRYDEEVHPLLRTQQRMQFQMHVITSRQSLLALPDAQVLYMLAEISADPRMRNSAARRDSNLNLTLVIDRSNSMSGTRMDKVKIAAQQIIDMLSAHDVISVVVFSDRAEVIIPATRVQDKTALKARISLMNAFGSTEIYHGLSVGLMENRKHLSTRMVNHVVLLTDGQTYNDEPQCLELAREAQRHGVGISAMGLGHDWNDDFLDKLASLTGGRSVYIDAASAVSRFMQDHVRQLTHVFAERVGLSIAPDPDVQMEMAFKLMPAPQPLSLDEGVIPLGSLQVTRPITVLLQLQVPSGMDVGFRSFVRLCTTGDILANESMGYQAISDMSLEIVTEQGPDDPPSAILDALSKMNLYRMQERAREALERGDIAEATRRFEHLATRLFEAGEEELAHQALNEARVVAHTHALSDKGRKTLRFQTRYLLGAGDPSPDELKDNKS